MSEKLFRVIKIISNKELIINGGTANNLSVGDNIEIIVQGDEIIDSFNNNKKIGRLYYVKDTLTIKRLTPTYSICHKTTNEVGKSFMAFSQISASLSGFSPVETIIKVDPNQITGGYPDNVDDTIILGDYAQKAFE